MLLLLGSSVTPTKRDLALSYNARRGVFPTISKLWLADLLLSICC